MRPNKTRLAIEAPQPAFAEAAFDQTLDLTAIVLNILLYEDVTTAVAYLTYDIHIILYVHVYTRIPHTWYITRAVRYHPPRTNFQALFSTKKRGERKRRHMRPRKTSRWESFQSQHQ